MTKLAFVSDQLATPGGYGGAEKLLAAVAEQFPTTPIFTPVYNRQRVPESLQTMPIHTSFLQGLPFSKTHIYFYLPLFPWAVEAFDLQSFDTIVSFHHSVAKGVLVRPDATHICYCHTPARYLWDQYWTYLDMNPLWNALPFQAITPFLRAWDTLTASRVDHFVANSQLVAARIQKYYRREAQILYPPVETHKFHHCEEEDFYLAVGRLVEYKGFDIAIETFNQLQKPLIIVGDGPLYSRLKKMAGPTVTLKGRVSESELIDLMSRCKALIHPGTEDFGITMAEAQAAGKPVIALNRGGAQEIVRHEETGLLVAQKTPQDFALAVQRHEKMIWSPTVIQANASRFQSNHFITGFNTILSPYIEEPTLTTEIDKVKPLPVT
jgi:glycosyltransferase involved in cell wall biosynthesis